MASSTRRRATASTPAGSLSRLPWAVAALAFAVFLPALGNGFVNWDDDRNSWTTHTSAVWGSRTCAGLVDIPARPLPSAHLDEPRFDYVIWGLDARGYHLTNAILHAATALLVCLVFGELIRRARGEAKASRRSLWGAAVGAALFAIHPLRVESVAWASERRDVLSGLFYALTLWLYVRGRLAAALGAFVAALLSKVIVATLPVALLALDWYPLRRRLELRALLEKLPFFGLALVFGLVAVGRHEAGLAGATENLDLYPGLRLALSAWALAFYLWKSVAPFGLYPLVAPTAEPQPTDALYLASGALVLLITAAAAWLWRKGRPALAAVWTVYVATLLPVLSILRLDRQQAVADHHSYLATLGFAALAGGMWAAWRDRGGRAPAVAAIAVLSLFGVLTVRQIGYWKDSETLWRRTAEAYPQAMAAHNNLGRALAEQGRDEEAIAAFERAAGIDSGYAQAQYNLGTLLMRMGRLAEAEAALRTSLQREPRFAQAWSNLGNCLLRPPRRRSQPSVRPGPGDQPGARRRPPQPGARRPAARRGEISLKACYPDR